MRGFEAKMGGGKRSLKMGGFLLKRVGWNLCNNYSKPNWYLYKYNISHVLIYNNQYILNLVKELTEVSLHYHQTYIVMIFLFC